MQDALNPPPCSVYLGFQKLERVGDRVRVTFLPSDEMCNPRGVVQGGILAGLLDDTIGVMLALGAPGRMWTTVQMSVSYLQAALPNEPLFGEATTFFEGRRTFFVDATLMKADGCRVARGTATCAWQGRASGKS